MDGGDQMSVIAQRMLAFDIMDVSNLYSVNYQQIQKGKFIFCRPVTGLSIIKYDL